MAIEFRCQQCNTLLRIADGTTGRQAKCPECGTMMTVPAPASDMPASGVPGESPPSYPPPPPPPSQGEDPFSSGQERPAGQESQWNPYQSPGPSAQAPWQAQPYGSQFDTTAASARLAGPAIALIVVASLGLALQLIALPINLWQLGAGPQPRPPIDMPLVFEPGFAVGSGILNMIVAIVMLVGAIKMKKLESYGFAMTASILAVIPCFSPCCCLDLPFGIWALVVLSDARVRAAFRG